MKPTRQDWPIHQYHADREYLSHSAEEIFIRSPKLYKMWHDGLWERPETKATEMGAATHVGVLEPGKWPKDRMRPTEVEVCPAGTRSAALYKKAVSEHGGIVILQNEEHAVRSMISAVQNHEQAKKILDGAETETSWTFEYGGFPCRCRLDILRRNIRLIADIKTAADPSEDAFTKQAANLGYHRQEAWYRAAFGGEIDTFLWIVVGSSEPFDCFVYVMDAESIEIGEQQNQRYLAELRTCWDSGDWGSRHRDGIITTGLPGWYKRKELG